MPEIIVTILQLLPETTGCGIFKIMSMRSIAAVSSSFGENIQHVGRLFRNRASFLGSAQQNIPLFSLLLILAVQCRLV
jgi:hypothetical protein